MFQRRRLILIAVAVVSLAMAGAISFQHGQQSGESAPRPIVVRPLPPSSELGAVVRTQKSEIPAPLSVPANQDDGDRMVRAAFAGLSVHPQLVAWLLNDQLLRRMVVAVELVAGGSSPASELEFLRPAQAFVVQRRGEELVISASSFRRYDMVAEVVTSLRTEDMVAVYRQLLPRLEAAHRELAWYGPGFDTRVLAAIDHLLEAPIPRRAPAVSRQTLSYAFADPALEALSGAQRHLLRMGPANAARVQAKLRALRQALAPTEPPQPGEGEQNTRQLADNAGSTVEATVSFAASSSLQRGSRPTLELLPMAE